MEHRPWPADLDLYSSRIGENVLMVQGPGGNTSFKDGKIMWVKASGTRLIDAVVKKIFVGVDTQSGETLQDQNHLRPSIEKDFHLLIPFPYVVHTHSLRAIAFAIEGDFGSKAKEFPEIAFVPYARPGADLCNSLSGILDYRKHKAAILQNHGFLTWGQTMEDAYEILMAFESDGPKVNLEDIDGNSAETILDHSRAITPDYAVFLSASTQDEILNFTGDDLWKKYMYYVAMEAINHVGPDKEINYLTPEEVFTLQNWESEKFRVAKN